MDKTIFDEVSQLYNTNSSKNQQQHFPNLNKEQKEILQDSLQESIKVCKPLFYMFFDSMYKRIKEISQENPDIIKQYEIMQSEDDDNQQLEKLQQSYPLTLDQQIKFETRQAKKSLTETLYAHKVVRCFFNDELFQHIVSTISQCVISRLNDIHESYEQKMRQSQESNQTSIRDTFKCLKKQQLDPVKLEAKVKQLQDKLNKQTKDFHMELDYYRNIFSRQASNSISKDAKDIFEVRYFNECDQLEPEMQSLMNQRIREIQNQYTILVQQQLKTQKNILIRLHQYEKLKQECHYLIDLPISEIIESLPALEQDPQKIWDLLEKYYHQGFFENVIYNKYGHLFEDSTEERYVVDLNEIRDQVASQIEQLYQQCQTQMKQMRLEYTDKVCELYAFKDKHQTIVEQIQKEEFNKAQELFSEKERQIFDRWDAERSGLMKEMEELEKQNAHVEQLVAKEKFRLFAFRWRIMKKVHKMGKFDRDSHEFMRANLEVQELVKSDIDQRIELQTIELNEKCKEAQKEQDEMIMQVTELKFQIKNFQTQIQIKDTIIEEARMQEQMREQNLKHARDKRREVQSEKDILQNDYSNLKGMVVDLEAKNKHLLEKIEKIKDAKNMSILDHKVLYNKNDKNLQRSSLVEEINEALIQCAKKLSNGDQTEKRNAQVGTNIKNINKDICYKSDFGVGILFHQGTQCDKVIQISREVQSELKKDEIEKINNSRNAGMISVENIDKTNNEQRKLSSRQSTLIRHSLDKSNSKDSKNSSIDRNGQEHYQNNQSLHSNSFSKNQLKSQEGKSSKSKFEEKHSMNEDRHSLSGNLSKSGSYTNNAQKNKLRKTNTINKEFSLGQSNSQSAYQQDNSRTELGMDAESDEHIIEHENDTSSKELTNTGTQLQTKFAEISKQEIKADLMKIINYNFPTDPANVFYRLWTENEERQVKLKDKRIQQKQKDENSWKVKLANSNQLQKTFNGLPLYTDPTSGRSFIHIDDLRLKASQALNKKPSHQYINQQINESYSDIHYQNLKSKPLQEQEPTNDSYPEDTQLEDNLFLNQNSSVSPLSVYLPNIYQKSFSVSRNAKIVPNYSRESENSCYQTAQSFYKSNSKDRSQFCFTPSQISALKQSDRGEGTTPHQYTDQRFGNFKKRIQSGIINNMRQQRKQQSRNQSSQYNSLIKSFCQSQKVQAIPQKNQSLSPNRNSNIKTFLVSNLDHYKQT